MKAYTTGRSIIATFPDNSQVLVVDVTIDCPECGQHTIRLAGHHLRAIRAFLHDVIEANPTLTGDEENLHLVDSQTFHGTPSRSENN